MDTFNWCTKFNLALCAGEAAVSKEEVAQSLPTPEQLAQYGRKSPDTIGGDVQSAPAHCTNSPHLLAAHLCEISGMDDEALAFVQVIYDLAPNLGGDPKPSSHILGHCVKGRVMARRGQLKAAAEAFEAAVSASDKYELWLLTAFALRDLKLHVLDGMGHGDHGSCRLGAVLRRLTGSAASLSSVLDGLDAEELRGMPAPDASYRVDYPQAEAGPSADQAALQKALATMRVELEALRVIALHTRAVSEGVDATKLVRT
jgi:hypothetical protein